MMEFTLVVAVACLGSGQGVHDRGLLDETVRSVGCSLAWVGDLNRDGTADLLVGGAGRAWVVSCLDGTILFEWPEKELRRGFGRIVGSAGDLDGDGVGECIVATVWPSPDKLTVFSGSRGRELAGIGGTAPIGGFAALGTVPPTLAVGFLSEHGGEVQLLELAGGALVVRTQCHSDDSTFGSSVCFVRGATEADGMVAIGAPQRRCDGPGYVAVHSSGDGSLVWRAEGVDPKLAFGEVVMSGQDLNGDGTNDVLVGATSYEIEVTPRSGPRGIVTAHSGIDGSLLFEVSSEQRGFGRAVQLVGDCNGDGTPDIAIGADDVGRVSLFSGQDGAVIRTSSAFSAGIAEKEDTWPEYAYFGTALAGLDDVDGDGLADLAVGYADPYDPRPGGVVILSGRTGTSILHLDGARFARRSDSQR